MFRRWLRCRLLSVLPVWLSGQCVARAWISVVLVSGKKVLLLVWARPVIEMTLCLRYRLVQGKVGTLSTRTLL